MREAAAVVLGLADVVTTSRIEFKGEPVDARSPRRRWPEKPPSSAVTSPTCRQAYSTWMLWFIVTENHGMAGQSGALPPSPVGGGRPPEPAGAPPPGRRGVGRLEALYPLSPGPAARRGGAAGGGARPAHRAEQRAAGDVLDPRQLRARGDRQALHAAPAGGRERGSPDVDERPTERACQAAQGVRCSLWPRHAS